MEEYMDKPEKDKKFNQFIRKAESVGQKDTVIPEEYIHLAQSAMEAYREDPDNREQIAQTMTSIWGYYEDISTNKTADEIGSEFADLGLPDHHVDINGYESIADKCNKLGEKIEAALNRGY
ncbi:hypothetical protein BRC19_01025 [Candidatus Saccharibacteria bacterium QS_5_54_17]|nr:MAG: hypothetical protein BRC19_01025 [Candidatus Saccharibacteria bacterium QS_5_54_17]